MIAALGLDWSVWWVWFVLAFLLGIMELIIPAQIFLGLTTGAIGVGFAHLLGIPGISTSLPLSLLTMAILSGVAWLVIRKIVGVHPNQVKVWDRDINDD